MLHDEIESFNQLKLVVSASKLYPPGVDSRGQEWTRFSPLLFEPREPDDAPNELEPGALGGRS